MKLKSMSEILKDFIECVIEGLKNDLKEDSASGL